MQCSICVLNQKKKCATHVLHTVYYTETEPSIYVELNDVKVLEKKKKDKMRLCNAEVENMEHVILQCQITECSRNTVPSTVFNLSCVAVAQFSNQSSSPLLPSEPITHLFKSLADFPSMQNLPCSFLLHSCVSVCLYQLRQGG